MKLNEILKALSLVNTEANRKYCNKLANIFTLCKELVKMPSYFIYTDVIKGNLQMVRQLPEILPTNYTTNEFYRRACEGLIFQQVIYGNFEQWQRVEIKHNNGKYIFDVPTDNEFYYAICEVLGVCYIKQSSEEIEPICKIVTYPEIIEAIKKASKFVSDDDLRPSMTGVCIDISNNGIQIVATNAHYLYTSKFYGGEISTGAKYIDIKESEVMQFIIDGQSIKALRKLKVSNDSPVNIDVFDNGTIKINGLQCNLIDARYPDYKCVIPEYKDSMTFDRKQMIENIKKVEKFANKSTTQVNFYLNSNIKLSACDIDFAFEAKSEMNYLNKSFNDMEIAFNGKLMQTVLNNFKDSELKMYSAGINTKAAIFSNDNEICLLMPLMINNDY